MTENPSLNTQNKPNDVKNPYPLGTKKFLVTKMLFAGEDDTAKISSELAVKPATIYNTKAELRKMGYLPKGQVSKMPKEPPPPIVVIPSPPPITSQAVTPPNPPPVNLPDETHREQVHPVIRNADPANLMGDEKSSPGKEETPSREDKNSSATIPTKPPPAFSDNKVDRGQSFRMVAEKTPPPEDTFNSRNEMERIIFLEASPILKKVALNPKVYLWYDYAKTELGFKGDVGDFLIDTVEDFFRSRGFRIVISQTKEVGY